MSMRLKLQEDRHATVISTYAPTMPYSNEEKEAFYKQLSQIVLFPPANAKIVLLSDFLGISGPSQQNVIVKSQMSLTSYIMNFLDREKVEGLEDNGVAELLAARDKNPRAEQNQ